jgi:hypothetical protein
MILDYTIFGERNSGTNYLKKSLQENLQIPFTQKYGFKHWFIKDLDLRGRPNTTTDNECLKSLDFSDHTLFIYILRNPYDWVGAMYERPYHINEADKSSLFKFISNPHISYEVVQPSDHGENSQSAWFKDELSQTFFIEESENLISLRNQKNQHFKSLAETVKYFFLIRQEHLYSDLIEMIERFELEIRLGNEFTLLDYIPPRKYDIDEQTKIFIQENLKNDFDSEYYQETM